MLPPSDPVTPPEPTLQCDLVMKGGITSGVVYPRAMARLARDYRIRNIGGTSVGAIAAALTAAAEYWRQANPRNEGVRLQQQQMQALVDCLNTERDGQLGWEHRTRDDVVAAEAALLAGDTADHGFAGLYAIPDDIGANLKQKFQPSAKTGGAFHFLLAVLDAKTPYTRLLAALTRQFHWLRVISAVVIGLLSLAFILNPEPVQWLLLAALGVALLVIGWRRVMVVLQSATEADSPAPANPPSSTGLASWLERVPAHWLIAGAPLVLWAAYIQWAIGWQVIGSWAWHHAGLVAGLLMIAALLTQGDALRDWLLAKRRASTPRHRQLLELAFLVGGVVLGAVLIWLNWTTLTAQPRLVAAATCGVVIGWMLGAVIGLYLNAFAFIPANFNGLCTGMGDDDALTPWLTRKINILAGLDSKGSLLTFGMLKTLPPDRRITFEAIATDLTRGVPLDVPAALRRYRFRPAELRQFFPDQVLHQLGVDDLDSTDLVPFPDADDIPVVVAARMSMSFPVLFSTVPVYFDDGVTRQYRQCMLSDGGIVSNFPVHKFDRSLSPWPTFAIDLIDDSTALQEVPLADQIWLNPILTATGGTHMEEELAVTAAMAIPDSFTTGLPDLATRIVNTARGWMDHSQKELPGYRERIVGIRLYPGEGGLNLTMGPEAITRLANRGMYGVHRLVDSWAPDPVPAWATEPDAERWSRSQWHQHRWLRYRIIMRSLENIGQEWRECYTDRGENARYLSIADLVAMADSANGEPTGMAYHWQFGANGMQAAQLTALFDAFAQATPQPPDRSVEQWPGVFDEPVSPEIEPRLLMMPPFT